jgi:hypothetical protein
MPEYKEATDFFKEVERSELTDEFELDDMSLDEIKSKIRTWQKTKFGKYYSLYAHSQNNITLRKEKYDWKIFYLITIIVLGLLYSIPGMIFPEGTTVDVLALYFIAAIYATFGFYYVSSILLLTRLVKATYDLTFDPNNQHQVKIEGKGKIRKSMHEIHTLKLSLRKRTQAPLALV